MNYIRIARQSLTVFLTSFGTIWLIIESIALFNVKVSELGMNGFWGIVATSVFHYYNKYAKKEEFFSSY